MLFSPILCKQHEGSIQCFQPWAQLRFAISAFISTRLFALRCVYIEALSDPRLSSSSFPFLFVEFNFYSAAQWNDGKKATRDRRKGKYYFASEIIKTYFRLWIHRRRFVAWTWRRFFFLLFAFVLGKCKSHLNEGRRQQLDTTPRSREWPRR